MTHDTSPGPVPPVAPTWRGLLADLSLVPRDVATVPEVTAAFDERLTTTGDLVGALALTETELSVVRGFAHPVRLVVSGGAGAIAGPMQLARRLGVDVRGIQVALRDVADLPANARRVVAALDAALDEGALDDDVPVHVEIPADSSGARPSGAWLRAVDEIAAAELVLHLRTDDPYGGPAPSPAQVAARIDAALDRETPVSVTAASRAVSGEDTYGVVNLLLATRQLFDGADHDQVAATLALPPVELLEALRGEQYLPATRRWFTSASVTDVDRVARELTDLGLLND